MRCRYSSVGIPPVPQRLATLKLIFFWKYHLLIYLKAKVARRGKDREAERKREIYHSKAETRRRGEREIKLPNHSPDGLGMESGTRNFLGLMLDCQGPSTWAIIWNHPGAFQGNQIRNRREDSVQGTVVQGVGIFNNPLTSCITVAAT